MSRYSETLLDHAQYPDHLGTMDTPDMVGRSSLHGHAPEATLYLKVDGGVVSDAKFQAFGCAALLASCSVLTDLVIGQPLATCAKFSAHDVAKTLDGIPPDKMFCAELAIEALRDALRHAEQ
jgi:NifU-like protein involved in Fe-S cluster formation